MKKIMVLFFSLALLTLPLVAIGESQYQEEAIIVDFSSIHPNSDAFAAAYSSSIVSFDGHVEYYDSEIVTIDGRYTVQDVIRIYPGDSETDVSHQYGFVIRNLIEAPTCSYDSWNLAVNQNVSIIAEVVGLDEEENMVELKDATIVRREVNKPIDTQTVLNASNCEELSSILDMPPKEYHRNELVEQFASNYKGKAIELDCFIYSIDENWPNRENYDIIFFLGDHRDDPYSYKRFMFENVSIQDLGFDGSELPYFLKPASDVRIIGQIIGYDDSEPCILLAPTSIEYRNSYVEAIIDTSAYSELSKGSKGDAVKMLQQRLIELKYLSDKADGQYGSKTKSAIEKFQSGCNLEVTGISDPMTQAILFSENAPEATLSISCSSVVIGSSAKTVWYVDGQEFTLTGDKVKTIETIWGTYKFNAYGEYEKID